MLGLFYGTRPEYIKLIPLFEELSNNSIPYRVIQVQQHTTLIERCRADKIINFPSVGNRLDDIIKGCLVDCFDGITKVLIQGDTSTALGIALAAFHRQLPIIHLEAGLRTNNKFNPFPEEVNRQLISRLANYHLCPRNNDRDNLYKENIKEKVFVVGNTSIDNLKHIKLSSGMGHVICTIHRRENTGLFREWFEEIDRVAKFYNHFKFKLITHPSIDNKLYLSLPNLNIIEPMHQDSMHNALSTSEFVITDSGGIQEEATYFGKHVFVCRKTTERPNYNIDLVTHPQFLLYIIDDYFSSIDYDKNLYCDNVRLAFGDGNAARNIVNVLKTIL